MDHLVTCCKLVYTILKPSKWRHKPGKILYGEYEPQASILYEHWLGLRRHFYALK